MDRQQLPQTSMEPDIPAQVSEIRVAERSGLRALCACCAAALLPEVERLDIPAFPIGMYMRESYLDRQV